MSNFPFTEIPGDTDLRAFRVHLDPQTVVCRLSGTLDGSTAADLAMRLQSALSPVPKNFLLDLGDVDYLSSMGLSVLLKTALRLKSDGALCQFYDPQLSVRRVLEISKWSHVVLDPGTMPDDSPFRGYVSGEEPSRARRRNRTAGSNPPRLFKD